MVVAVVVSVFLAAGLAGTLLIVVHRGRAAAAEAVERIAALERDVATARVAVAEQEARGCKPPRPRRHCRPSSAPLDERPTTSPARLRAMTVGGHDPATLWALELARSERRWRSEVSPDRNAISPIVGADNPLLVALEIEAAAAREEAGTDVRVEWNLAAPLGPGLSLAVLRVVQELLAVAVKEAELVVLRVSEEGDDLLVEVTAVASDGTSVRVTLPGVAAGGIETVQGRVRLRQAGRPRTETASAAPRDSSPVPP